MGHLWTNVEHSSGCTQGHPPCVLPLKELVTSPMHTLPHAAKVTRRGPCQRQPVKGLPTRHVTLSAVTQCSYTMRSKAGHVGVATKAETFNNIVQQIHEDKAVQLWERQMLPCQQRQGIPLHMMALALTIRATLIIEWAPPPGPDHHQPSMPAPKAGKPLCHASAATLSDVTKQQHRLHAPSCMQHCANSTQHNFQHIQHN